MELRDFLRILRAHWVGLVALVLLGGLASYGYAMLQPRVYTASSTGFVTVHSDSTDAGTTMVSTQIARDQVASFVDIGTWRSVAQYAIKTLDLHTTPEALVSHVTVTNPADTVFVTVSATSSDPKAARDLAEAWVRGMQQQVAALQTGGGSGHPAVDLVPGDSAALPTAPSSPNVLRYVQIGLIVGLVLGVAYMLIRHVLDRRVRDPQEIERKTRATVVGWIPRQKDLGTARTFFEADGVHSAAGFSPAVEAVRELRTNLQYMSVDEPPRVIVVTSPLPGDGKSVTAANLARSLAAAGERTVLIDADLRRPVVAASLSLPESPGLTDILAGRVTLSDVAHVVDADRNLVVITAGRIPPNPSEVLGSKRMTALLAELRREATVIIDSPPAVPVTDAAVLSAAADGVLTVVSAGHTTYDLLQRSLANVERAGGRSLGVVLNKVPRRGASAGNYGYYGARYATGYASAETTAEAERIEMR